MLFGAWVVFSGIADVRGTDMQLVYTLEKTLNGLPLYTDPEKPPFDIAQYTPVYYLAVTSVVSAIGIATNDVAAVTAVARGISLTCGLFLIWGLYAMSRRAFGLSRDVALLIAALAFVLTSPWFFLARSDALAELFVMSSLSVIVAETGAVAMWQLIASAGFAVLAIFTKQNEIQIVAILLPYLALFRGRHQAAIWATAVAGFGAVALLACIHQWPSFLSNVIGGLDNGISLKHFFRKTLPNFLYPQAALLVLAGLAVTHWARRPLDAQRGLFVVALPIFFLFAVVTALKRGASENYFNEFTLLALPAVALLMTTPESKRPVWMQGANGKRLMLFLGVLLSVGPLLLSGTKLNKYWWHSIDPSASLMAPSDSLRSDAYRELTENLGRRMNREGGYILAFPLGANAALNAYTIVPQKDVAETSYQRGLVSFAAFRELVAEGQLRYVVVDATSSKLPESFLGASLAGFRPDETVGEFTIYTKAAE